MNYKQVMIGIILCVPCAVGAMRHPKDLSKEGPSRAPTSPASPTNADSRFAALMVEIRGEDRGTHPSVAAEVKVTLLAETLRQMGAPLSALPSQAPTADTLQHLLDAFNTLQGLRKLQVFGTYNRQLTAWLAEREPAAAQEGQPSTSTPQSPDRP